MTTDVALAGLTDGGFPPSMQIARRPFEEPPVLRAGDAYQRGTDWHLRVRPVLPDTLQTTEVTA